MGGDRTAVRWGEATDNQDRLVARGLLNLIKGTLHHTR